VDLVESVGAEEQSAAVVEPGEGAFDDPALASEPGAVVCLAAGDDRFDTAAPDEAAVLVVVVAAIGEYGVRAAAWPAGTAAHRRDTVEQGEQLGDVVAVGSCKRPGERQAAAVYEDVVLAARTAPVDRAGADFRAPFFACR
jgi:hypothetical protein